MSEADRMFDELGFVKREDNISIQYRKGFSCFDYLNILFYTTSEHIGLESEGDVSLIDVDTHKAIYTKVKELGWFDE